LRVAAETGLSDHPSIIDAQLAMAHVLRERNALGTVAGLLDHAHDLASEVNRETALAWCAIERAELELANDRPERSLDHLERHRTSGHAPLPPLLAARAHAVEARVLLAMGEPVRAERVVASGAAEGNAYATAVAVQVALARHDVAEAETLLGGWPDDGEYQSQLAHDLYDAVARDVAGDRSTALELLDEVVSKAEPEGHVGLFIEAGVEAQRLLRARFQDRPSPYLKLLVRPERPVSSAVLPAGHPGSLSAREVEVMRYLPTRLTNAEIAEELFVSLNTVKTYLKSIYTKLGVNTRREAIEKAEELGLV